MKIYSSVKSSFWRGELETYIQTYMHTDNKEISQAYFCFSKYGSRLKMCSYLAGNTLRVRYRDQPVNAVRETVTVYCENHTKHINTPSAQNAEI
jgi:hypothetical protein